MAAAFDKFKPEVVQHYLNAIYSQAACSQRSKTFIEEMSVVLIPQDEVLGALELAHMLDAPRIRTVSIDFEIFLVFSASNLSKISLLIKFLIYCSYLKSTSSLRFHTTVSCRSQFWMLPFGARWPASKECA